MHSNKASLVFALSAGALVVVVLLAGFFFQQPIVWQVWQFAVENRINPFSFRLLEPGPGSSPNNFADVEKVLWQEVFPINTTSRERYIRRFERRERGFYCQTADSHVNVSLKRDGSVDEIVITGEPQKVIAWLDILLRHQLMDAFERRKIHEFFVGRNGSLEKGYWSGSFGCVSVDDGLIGNSFSVVLHPSAGQVNSNYCYKRL